MPAPDPFAVAAEAAQRLSAVLRGIEAWQNHPHHRRMADPPVLWQSGATRLLDFGGEGPVTLAIPSLINRAQVLDLAPDRSLMRYLATNGLRTLLLDWGGFGPQEGAYGLADILRHRLIPAVQAVADRLGPVSLLGYCMGGTLATALATALPGSVARLALIGAPWEFDAGSGTTATLRGLGREYGPDRLADHLRALGTIFGAVPGDLFQLLFALLDPGLVLAKFRRFARCDPDSAAARFFVEMEDWLNDPVALPGPVAVELLIDWQLHNVTGRGLWSPLGPAIRPDRLSLPVLAFCATRDRIAPSTATEPLARAIPGARILRPAAGHVGMILGRHAQASVWQPLRDFLAAGSPRGHTATA